MNCVDKFLDLVAPLPRRIVRLLKLLKTVEENSKDLKIKLQKSREKYIQKLKENNLKNLDSTSLKSIEKMHKELITLSDYKLEIIKELNYIIESSFISKLAPIIEEGQKEIDNNINGLYDNNSFVNPEKINLDNYKKKDDIDSLSNTGTSNLIGKKKNRTKMSKNRKIFPENTEEFQNLQKTKIYCKCKKQSYGMMIECDNPSCQNGQWFHLSCVGIDEGKEPSTDWYCCSDCENSAKNTKKIKNKRKKN